jgi:hypothetical protein
MKRCDRRNLGRFVSRKTGVSMRPSRVVPSSMIPTASKPKYSPGTRVRVTQYVRVGHRRWLTQVEGLIEKESRRSVGGIEMGGKASYCQQETIRLRRDDGEITEVAVDAETRVDVVTDPTAPAQTTATPAAPTDPTAPAHKVTVPGS